MSNHPKADQQIEELLKITKDFPAFLFIGVGEKYGGFAYVQAQNEKELVLLQAEIFDALKHKKNLMDMMKHLIGQVEIAAK